MGFQLDSSPQKWLIAGGSKSITVAAELSQRLCLGHVAALGSWGARQTWPRVQRWPCHCVSVAAPPLPLP